MLTRYGLACQLVAIILSATISAASPQQPAGATSPQEEADHDALRALKAIYEKAIRENQIGNLSPYLHADFHGVMVTGQPVSSSADLERYWHTIKDLIGPGGTYTTTLNPERSLILGDIALARGTSDDYVKSDKGREFRFLTHWSAVLQREGTAWKIRYVQGTMDPVGNPFVRTFTRDALIRIGGFSLVAGIIVGLAFGVVWRRRRTRRA
jgi:ketosteroid isomerase-like protein